MISFREGLADSHLALLSSLLPLGKMPRGTSFHWLLKSHPDKNAVCPTDLYNYMLHIGIFFKCRFF